MNLLSLVYRPSLTLLTDLYQLTMAMAYWKTGKAEQDAVFHLVFRRCPFGGQYAVACGLAYVIDLLQNWKFAADDLEYLAKLQGSDARPLFDRAFLDFLGRSQFVCDVDALPEGTVVFPQEPLIRVRGPLWQSQIVETVLLTIVNYQTLVATKAARVCREAGTDEVLEFGLRRAQGIDGGLTASRAAFVGGCGATSNLLAGKLFGIPVRGTHAHSWVMSFDSELEAFRRYAESLPNNCIFLVDTYDTLEGVRHAVEVAKELRRAGHEMLGVRLDSGDPNALSRAARELLDEAGFPGAKIVASGDLDEHLIHDLKQQGARIDTWGVGTRLVTGHDQPALGGVYKLSAIRDDEEQAWSPRMKLSEQSAKSSIPGVLQVRRFMRDGRFLGDVIYQPDSPATREMEMILPDGRAQKFPTGVAAEDLLVPVFRGGRSIYPECSLSESQKRTRQQVAALSDEVQRLQGSTPYPVGLERRLHELKMSLAAKLRVTSPGS